MALTRVRGMLTPEELRRLVAEGEIETVIAAFPDMYGRLMGKRVTGEHFVASILPEGSLHACDYLFTVDMEMDTVSGYRFASWERGYGDLGLKPDYGTLRRASWLPKTALVLCDAYLEHGEEPVAVAPRTILQKQLEHARALGYVPQGASEVEFYLFKETYESASAKGYQDLRPIGEYIEDYHIFQGTKEEGIVGAIRQHMTESGVPVEFSKGEWGPGQHEVNLRYDDLLTMADRHVIYKHAAKEIAWQRDAAVTFMAKWNENLAGSSMHIHVSLRDLAGNPAFLGNQAMGDGVEGSDVFRWFLGGWLAHAREIAAFYAPFPNSYKRYQAGSFAPVGIAWGYDNRTLSFRVVGKGPSLRIECRAPGADANPYLVFAVSVAAGMDGIARRIEPPPPVSGNAYLVPGVEHLPRTLPEAVAAMEGSAWLREALGADVVEHYAHFFRTEQEKFDAVVTDWERRRYFERV
jgi:glutamine synthetase